MTCLSTEIEGRGLGGGLLKLEPSDVSRILIPYPKIDGRILKKTSRELDKLIRAGNIEAARDIADQLILYEGLKVTSKDIQLIRTTVDKLRDRRLNK